jgi:hypothetical protein
LHVRLMECQVLMCQWLALSWVHDENVQDRRAPCNATACMLVRQAWRRRHAQFFRMHCALPPADRQAAL